MIHTDTALALIRESLDKMGLSYNTRSIDADKLHIEVEKNNVNVSVWFDAHHEAFGFNMIGGGYKAYRSIEEFERFFERYIEIQTEFLPNVKIVSEYYTRVTGKNLAYEKFIGNQKDGYRAIYYVLGENDTQAHIYFKNNVYSVDIMLIQKSSNGSEVKPQLIDRSTFKLNADGTCEESIVYDIMTYLTKLSAKYRGSALYALHRRGANEFEVEYKEEDIMVYYTIEFPNNERAVYSISEVLIGADRKTFEIPVELELSDAFDLAELLNKVKDELHEEEQEEPIEQEESVTESSENSEEATNTEGEPTSSNLDPLGGIAEVLEEEKEKKKEGLSGVSSLMDNESSKDEDETEESDEDNELTFSPDATTDEEEEEGEDELTFSPDTNDSEEDTIEDEEDDELTFSPDINETEDKEEEKEENEEEELAFSPENPESNEVTDEEEENEDELTFSPDETEDTIEEEEEEQEEKEENTEELTFSPEKEDESDGFSFSSGGTDGEFEFSSTDEDEESFKEEDLEFANEIEQATDLKASDSKEPEEITEASESEVEELNITEEESKTIKTEQEDVSETSEINTKGVVKTEKSDINKVGVFNLGANIKETTKQKESTKEEKFTENKNNVQGKVKINMEELTVKIVKDAEGHEKYVRFSSKEHIEDIDYEVVAKKFKNLVNKINLFDETFETHGITLTTEEIERKIFAENVTNNEKRCDELVFALFA